MTFRKFISFTWGFIALPLRSCLQNFEYSHSERFNCARVHTAIICLPFGKKFFHVLTPRNYRELHDRRVSWDSRRKGFSRCRLPKRKRILALFRAYIDLYLLPARSCKINQTNDSIRWGAIKICIRFRVAASQKRKWLQKQFECGPKP